MNIISPRKSARNILFFIFISLPVVVEFYHILIYIDIYRYIIEEMISNDYFHLILFSFAMFIGAFSAGNLPIMINMSQKQLNSVNALGCGLLLGTALAVIIPEGIETLYATNNFQFDDHLNDKSIIKNNNFNNHDENDHKYDINEIHDSHKHEHEHGHVHGQEQEKTIIGVALLAGFMLMLIVDSLECCGGMHLHQHNDDIDKKHYLGNHNHSHSKSEIGHIQASNCGKIDSIALNDLDDTKHSSNSNKFSSGKFTNLISSSRNKQTTVTIGLIIHCLADGLALGSAKASTAMAHKQDADKNPVVSEGSSNLDFVVFMAIMLHKVPAAFSYAVYLRSTGLGRSAIRKTLVLFASSAPIGALVSFPLLQPGLLVEEKNNHLMIGFFILFSGGTFLYIAAVHILQEIKESSSINEEKIGNNSMAFESISNSNPLDTAGPHLDVHFDSINIDIHHQHHTHNKIQKKQLTLLILGSLIPFLLTMSDLHSHAHG